MDEIKEIFLTKFKAILLTNKLLIPSLAISVATFFPTIILSSFFYFLFSILPKSYSEKLARGDQISFDWFGILVFSPIVESILVIFFIHQFKKILVSQGHTICATSLLLAVFHSVFSPIWGLIILWMFIVHSYVYICTYEKSPRLAYARIVIAHAFHNGFVYCLMLTTQ